MERKKHIKLALQETSKGNFTDIIELIRENGLEHDSAIKVFINSCAACCNFISAPEKLSENQLRCVLIMALPYVNNPDEKYLLKYFQSIFHILKFLISKGSYRFIVELKMLLIPHFLPKDLTLEHKDVYSGIIGLIYNVVVTLKNQQNNNYNNDLVEISKIVTSASSNIFDRNTVLIKSHKCALCLSALKINLADYSFFVLRTVKSSKQPVMEDFINSLLDFLIFVMQEMICNNSIREASEFFKKSQALFSEMKLVNVHQILNICLILTPFTIDETVNLEEWTKGFDKLKSDSPSLLHDIISKLRIFFNNLFAYDDRNIIKASLGISEELLLRVLDCVVSNMCSQLALKKDKCSCECSVDTNYFDSVRLAMLFANLVIHYIQEKKTVSETFCEKTLKWISGYIKYVEFLNQSGCEKWKQAWKELSCRIYKLGTLLHKADFESYADCYCSLLKHTFKFEGFASSVVKNNILDVAFSALCQRTFRLKEYENCLALIALNMYSTPAQENRCFEKLWTLSKFNLKIPGSKDKPQELQRVTLVTAFEKFKDYLAGFIETNITISEKDKIKLLEAELRLYKKTWRSTEAIMAALKQFCYIADFKDIVKIIIDILGDCELSLHDDLRELVKQIQNQCEFNLKKEHNFDISLCLAVLSYYGYKYSSQDASAKNSEDMKKTINVMNDNKDPLSKDPFEECDIVSAYENLKFEVFLKTLNYLNRALNLISINFAENIKKEYLEIIYKLLLKIAYEYRLQYLGMHSSEAFSLALKYARIKNETEKILYAISFIIESGDVMQNGVANLIREADEIAKEMESHFEPMNIPEVVLQYYIFKSKTFFYCDIKYSYEIYKLVFQMYEKQASKDKLEFIYAQLLILHFKFNRLCQYQTEKHMENTMTLTIHKAYSIVVNKIKTCTVGSCDMSLSFDIILELARTYYLLRLPRDLRCYSIKMTLFTQQMVLPLRCVLFLIYLAHSDLQTSQFDHCNVKLSGINDILCLPRHEKMKHGIDNGEVMKISNLKLPDEVEAISNQIEELALNIPAETYEQQFSPSSPVLTVEYFNPPMFLSHGKTCECFYCSCLEYQELILAKARLDALLHAYQKNVKLAHNFFEGALDLYSCFQGTYIRHKYKSHTKIGKDIIPDFAEKFRESYGYLLLDYSRYLMSLNEKTRALKTNNDLMELLCLKKTQHLFLYNEALMQKLSYASAVQIQSLHKGNDENKEILNVREFVSTPVSKKSSVIVEIQKNFLPPPKKHGRKRVPFVLSPPDEESSLNSNISLSSTVTKKKSNLKPFPTKLSGRVVNNRSPPSLNSHVASSSATPKFHIFVNSPTESKQQMDAHFSPERIKLKKCILFEEIPEEGNRQTGNDTPDTQIFSNLRTTRSVKSRLKQHISETSSKENVNDGTESKQCVGSGLRSKTKLLTQKLIESSNKKETQNDINAPGKHTRLVRKNLLRELLENEPINPITNTGTIKKSTRNRK